MRKTLWSLLMVLPIFAYAGQVRADDTPAPEQPKADAPKADAPKEDTVEQRMERRKEALQEAMGNQDFDKAIAVLEEIANDKDVGDDEKVMACFVQFSIVAKEKKDGVKASALAKKLPEMKKDLPAEFLNELAWTLLDTEGLKDRDLDVALALAKQAAELSKEEDGAILDTLARAYFEKGDLDKAIENQAKAVEKSENNQELPDDMKAQVKETLEKYKAKKSEK